MSDTRLKKRPRADEEGKDSNSLPSSSRAVAARRDEECWYEDGNLVLAARDVEFRVYMGPLVKHSPVFKDMLSLPQPDARTGNTVPRVDVTDSPEDLRHFLRCFALGNELYLNATPSGTSTAFDKVSAVVRLCHKYEVEDLLQQALRWLKARYPSSADGWHLRLCHEPTPLQSIGVVHLARLTHTSSLLIPAFLDCCTLTMQELKEGFEREDGQRECLSEEDFLRVLNARTELMRADAQAAIHILRPETQPYCPTKAECTNSLLQTLKAVAAATNPGRTRLRPHMSETWWERIENDLYTLCDSCSDDVDQRQQEMRLALWDRLPSIFGL
ncbi:hypothetical protein OH77DRAFT_1524454 [Trametes cingulata]|nr:hypothetical protein OH77DRAFT_1524454 [Trametes cingulata]